MSATPTRLRRVRRYAAIGAIAIVAVVALTFLGLATSPGRNLLAGIIERVARVDGISITITNLSGWPPFRFGAEKIVIADVDGPFAQIDNLSGGLRAGPLLTGGIEIDSIAAERVSIARRPKPPPDQPASDPIALSIDKLSLPRVELGEQLVGRAVVLAVDGAYRSRTNGLISASIDAKRTDDKTGSARVRIERADRHAPLLLDAGVEEAADGILIGLLGRESGPAYRLTTKTEARGDALEGSVLLASSGTARFDGSFTLAPTATTKRLTAKGRGDVGELLPPDLTGLLSGPIDAAIDIEWGGATKSALPRIVVREGTITSTAVRAKASGTLDDTQSNLVLEVDVARADRKPIAIPGMTQPARFEHVTLTGHAAPANGVVRFELAGSVAGLALADTTIARTELSLTLSSSGRDPFAGGKITYALRISPDAIQMPAMRLASNPGAPLTLAADGTFDTSTSIAVTKVSVALGAARATFGGELSRSDVKGKAIAQVPDLRVLAPLIGRTVSGALDVTADGTFFSAAGIRLKVDATGTGVDPGNPALARVFAGKSKIGTTLVRNAAGALSLSDLVVDAPGLKAKGSATIAAATIEAQLDGRLPDLSVFARDIEGGAQFALKASGARNAPTIDSTIKVERGKVYGKEVEAVAASLVGKPAANGWAGHLKLGGRYAGKRIEGDVDAAYEQASGVFNLSKIDVAAGDNRVRGALRRSPQGVLAGALDVTAPDLATLVALALIEASGSGNAKVTFAGAGAGQSLAIVFNGSKIKYQDIAVGTAEGTVDIDDVFGTPRVRGTVAATAVNAGALRLDTAKIGATVAGNATRFTAAAKGPDLDLSGNGTLSPQRGINEITIAALNGTAYQVPVKLSAPAVIRVDGGKVSIAATRLALGGGTLRAEGDVSPAMNLNIVADKVAISLANVFAADLVADGTLSGPATIPGQPPAPTIAWQIDGAGLRVAATRKAGLPPFAVKGSGNATLAQTTLEAKIAGGGASFTLNGKIPYVTEGLSVHAEGTAPLALLALDSKRELRLGGNARASLEVTGSLKVPQFAGTGDLVDATIADTETGFGIAGANGRIAFDGQRAKIEQISGRLLQGGKVSLGGTIDIAGKELPAALKIRVVDGRYTDGRVVNTTFSADLAIDGPLLGKGTVSGSIALGRTEIQLPDKLGSPAGAIEVKHVNARPAYKDPLRRRDKGAAAASSSGGALKLAIDLTNTGGIFVRGFGIDAEFGGSLRIGGTLDSPVTAGQFTMRRGRIELLGKRFDLSSGRLTFAGDLIPQLDFIAATTAGDVTVTMNVIGPAANPVISFSSSPDLPQEEILSRLLFERTVGTLSPLQAVQLIDALARFTGISGGNGIFDRIRQATGLDDLDVRQNAAGGTTVGVAKRINDRVRLGVEAGSGSTAGRVTVDLELTKDLKARGEAGQDGSGKVGLTYEHEY